MSGEPPSVDEQVATLQSRIDRQAEEARKAVLAGDVSDVFDAGMKMGILIGVGLATAHRIKETSLRDKLRGDVGLFYRHHDTRALAFGELANALTRWIVRLDSRDESHEPHVPDSVSGRTQ